MTTLPVNILVTTPASTSISFVPSAPFTSNGTSFTASTPIAPGVVVGTFVVKPAAWQGTLVLSGADASSFELDNGVNLVSHVALAARSYALVVTATP